MTVRKHFEHSPEFEKSGSIVRLAVTDPNLILEKTEATGIQYQQDDLSEHADTIIPKLISIAGIHIEDEELALAFGDHSNFTTDYKKFVEEYKKQPK